MAGRRLHLPDSKQRHVLSFFVNNRKEDSAVPLRSMFDNNNKLTTLSWDARVRKT